MKAKQNEIKALVHLLDDPDEGIYTEIRGRIVGLGDHVIPELERAWEEDDLGDLFRNRIEDILHSINLDSVIKRLKEWKDTGGEDLLEGTLIVSRYRYPDLDEDKVKSKLAKIRHDIWLELNEHLTTFEKVRVFNHIFFFRHRFGKDKNYRNLPQNNYVNEVMDSRKGGPLSLSVIYQTLAEDLWLPIRGVNLPGHFILACMNEGTPSKETEVLFYINTSSSGDIVGRREIDEYLEKAKISPKESFYVPCTNIDMVQRQIVTLIDAYQKLGATDRVEDLAKMLRLFPLT